MRANDMPNVQVRSTLPTEYFMGPTRLTERCVARTRPNLTKPTHLETRKEEWWTTVGGSQTSTAPSNRTPQVQSLIRTPHRCAAEWACTF